MRVETSKQPENSPSPSSSKIAEGKRKEESYREALSLQDVFSESRNVSGTSQKTSCQSDTGQEEMTQLEEMIR